MNKQSGLPTCISIALAILIALAPIQRGATAAVPAPSGRVNTGASLHRPAVRSSYIRAVRSNHATAAISAQRQHSSTPRTVTYARMHSALQKALANPAPRAYVVRRLRLWERSVPTAPIHWNNVVLFGRVLAIGRGRLILHKLSLLRPLGHAALSVSDDYPGLGDAHDDVAVTLSAHTLIVTRGHLPLRAGMGILVQGARAGQTRLAARLIVDLRLMRPAKQIDRLRALKAPRPRLVHVPALLPTGMLAARHGPAPRALARQATEDASPQTVDFQGHFGSGVGTAINQNLNDVEIFSDGLDQGTPGAVQIYFSSWTFQADLADWSFDLPFTFSATPSTVPANNLGFGEPSQVALNVTPVSPAQTTGNDTFQGGIGVLYSFNFKVDYTITSKQSTTFALTNSVLDDICKLAEVDGCGGELDAIQAAPPMEGGELDVPPTVCPGINIGVPDIPSWAPSISAITVNFCFPFRIYGSTLLATVSGPGLAPTGLNFDSVHPQVVTITPNANPADITFSSIYYEPPADFDFQLLISGGLCGISLIGTPSTCPLLYSSPPVPIQSGNFEFIVPNFPPDSNYEPAPGAPQPSSVPLALPVGPGITSIYPSSQKGLKGGQLVDIYGGLFTLGGQTTSAPAVYFGGTPAEVLNGWSDGHLRVFAPDASQYGTVDVEVDQTSSDNSTTFKSPQTPADQYSYQYPAPAISSISPNTGLSSPSAPFTSLDIYGSGFTTAYKIEFDAQNSDYDVTGCTDVTCGGLGRCTPPPGGFPSFGMPCPGYLRIQVATTPNCTPTKTIPCPNMVATVVDDHHIRITASIASLSAGESPFDVRVFTRCDGTYAATATSCGESAATPDDVFYAYPHPTITSLDPANGPSAGGTTVTVNGRGFTTATALTVDSQSVPFNIASDGVITFTSPGHSAGTGDVQVTTACVNTVAQPTSCGTSNTSPFTWLDPPTVTSVSPFNGPAQGGTPLTIRGSGFSSAIAVDIGGYPVPFQIDGDGQITITSTPSLAPGTYPVSVQAACARDLDQQWPNATACGTSGANQNAVYRALPLPMVSAVQPSSGLTLGGAAVSIVGAGFTTAVTVDMGTVSVPFQIVDDGHITIPATPHLAAGPYDVTVTTACGTANTINATSCLTSAITTTDVFTVNKVDTALQYTGATTGDYDDPVTLAATLTQAGGGPPVAGQAITFTLGLGQSTQSCVGTTAADGTVSCQIPSIAAPAGAANVVVSYAGNADYNGTAISLPFTINPEETTLTYTGAQALVANGQSLTLAALLQEDGSRPPIPSAQTVTLTLGSGASAQSCQGQTAADGTVSCIIAAVNQPLGEQPVVASFAGDSYYAPSSDSSHQALVFDYIPTGGAFMLGDQSSQPGASVTWWGHNWASANNLSGGPAPQSFKGFAPAFEDGGATTATPSCDATFLSSPGNSTSPPSSVPAYMAVAVTNEVTKLGRTISGTVTRIVIVKTDAGYQPDPGSSGTGTVVATVCGG